MPKAWVRQRQRDYYYRKSKEEEYRSRAAYKLLEAANRYGFIRSGDVVVDLGAAPGGWIQAARKLVGDKGFILGVDVRLIKPLGFTNIQTLIGDITDSQIAEKIRQSIPLPANVVISDVSPNISGVWELDHARQMDFAQQSLLIANSTMKAGGNFFVKIFQGDMMKDFLAMVREHFSFTKLVKPKASRSRSAEIFVLGMHMKNKQVEDT